MRMGGAAAANFHSLIPLLLGSISHFLVLLLHGTLDSPVGGLGSTGTSDKEKVVLQEGLPVSGQTC